MRERFRLARLALAGRGRDDHNWWLPWWRWWWLTAKCLLALATVRENHDVEVGEPVLAIFDAHEWVHFEFGRACDWSELVVPLRGFGWHVSSDGYP